MEHLSRENTGIRVTVVDDWKWYAGLSLVVMVLVAVYTAMIWYALA
jgi:hypothetical protein